jgi:hypothetical protein
MRDGRTKGETPLHRAAAFGTEPATNKLLTKPMNNFKFVSHFPALLLTFALAAGASPTTCIAASIKDPENNGSARLLALARDLNAGDRQVTAPFWKEIEGKAPLVESVATNTTHRRVTFLWRGTNDTSRVSIIGGFPGANLAKPMRRLADSDCCWILCVRPFCRRRSSAETDPALVDLLSSACSSSSRMAILRMALSSPLT